MKKKNYIIALTVIFASFLGCPRETPPIIETAPVRVEIGYADTTLWGYVSRITLRITGDDFFPIVDTHSVDSTIFLLDVPIGENRVFVSHGISHEIDTVVYLWARKDTNIVRDDTTRISLILTPLLAGGGDSILILRDSLPWGLTCVDSILEGLGVEYRIVPSDSFEPLSLNPFRHTLIIPSDQPRLFYERYRDYRAKFHAFVYTGGVMFFSACDRGWNEGDIVDARIIFPLGVRLDTIYHTDTVNIVTGRHPIVTALDDTLRGYFASWAWFADYPEFAQILTVRLETTADTIIERPTLLLYPYGSGAVLLSTQPLEYAYEKGYSIGDLLPRILQFLTRDDKSRYSP